MDKTVEEDITDQVIADLEGMDGKELDEFLDYCRHSEDIKNIEGVLKHAKEEKNCHAHHD